MSNSLNILLKSHLTAEIKRIKLLIILSLPLLHPSSILRPIQPAAIINTHSFRFIPSLQGQLRCRPSSHPGIAIKHHIARFVFPGTGLRVSESSLEFLWGKEERIRLGGEWDGDGGWDYTSGGEFGRFAHVDKDQVLLRCLRG